MTLIRLFPLINLSLIERVFVCVWALWFMRVLCIVANKAW